MDIILTNKGVLQQPYPDVDILNSGITVYEVIRIIDGVPLFLEEHFDRLIHSMQIKNWKPAIEWTAFSDNIDQLIRLNRKRSGNIRFEYGISNQEIFWNFSFIPHSYPTDKEYMTGVSVDLLFDERENPNAKVVQNEIREKSNQIIKERNLFEVLLVDRKGMITEGSRSNVFFVRNDIFYTAPSDMVLVGITRQKVMECLKNLNFCVVEEAIAVSQLNQFDAAFLTGTSPKVLPIRSLGNQEFKVRLSQVEKTMECYNSLIENYIRMHS
jgi:branched-chain amino acid aminotransferase